MVLLLLVVLMVSIDLMLRRSVLEEIRHDVGVVSFVHGNPTTRSTASSSSVQMHRSCWMVMSIVEWTVLLLLLMAILLLVRYAVNETSGRGQDLLLLLLHPRSLHGPRRRREQCGRVVAGIVVILNANVIYMLFLPIRYTKWQ